MAAGAAAQNPLDPPRAPDPAAATPQPAATGEARPAAAAVEPLAERHRRWLEEVEPLITRAEREMFLKLKRSYQRDAFIDAFWKVRDPYPRTTRNELKERWPLRVAEARARFGTLNDDRARILLLHDRPTGSFAVRCTASRVPAEVWYYSRSDFVDFPFLLIFVKPQDDKPARLWYPNALGLQQLARQVRPCVNGSRLGQIVNAVAADPDSYRAGIDRVVAKPRPSSQEWIQTFVAQSTDLPPGARPLPGELQLAFLGRHQSRTVVQGVISLAAADLGVAEFAGYRSRDLQLAGEVIKDGVLFESFRYRFDFPVLDGDESTVPIAFQRYLRPGDYRLILRLDDLNGDGVYRVDVPVTVPQIDRLFDPPEAQDPLTASLFAEAIAAIEAGETELKLIAPTGAGLLTGFVRFDALVAGDEIRKVRFLLDDKPILTKNRPPFDVRLDLGPHPDLHVLRAEGLDESGAEVASDEVLINGGGYRFRVKLIEPRRGRRYERSLRTRLEVEVPEGRSLDRIELFLNENRVATLYQEPFVHPIILPPGQPITYVRAVAYLPDGNSTEDMVFINAPEIFDEQLEVQMVELFTTVLDGGGRPVEGLVERDFKVFEDGTPQSIARFERVQDLPIHAGILIDNSASMHGVLAEVRKAALSFFQQAITPKDRAAVITFNSFPNLAVELTNDRAALGSGLAGLVAEGRTALYDSVMFALYYFTSIRGQRAILVLSDGKDESSRFTFDETLDYARRAGITIYTIGFRLGGELGARRRLARLADETGGRSFFISGIEELEPVYATIQRELRSQYLIAYQSTNTSDDDAFRTVKLEVDRPDVVVKTLSGYYP
ncbi:MAG: VWA domain-containing protein [Acidobacteria bacterium]|nr:MAG: VWA domain-containing protein [Acidobacteriota bacterium]